MLRYTKIYIKLQRRKSINYLRKDWNKLHKELIECTFQPNRPSGWQTSRAARHIRQSSNASIISSLERLIPSKDEMNRKSQICEENK